MSQIIKLRNKLQQAPTPLAYLGSAVYSVQQGGGGCNSILKGLPAVCPDILLALQPQQCHGVYLHPVAQRGLYNLLTSRKVGL